MAHGGARKGAGRPKKADEERIRTWAITAMVKTFGSEEGAFEHLANIALTAKSHRDQIAAMTKLMEYGFGKPAQSVDMQGDMNFKLPELKWK